MEYNINDASSRVITLRRTANPRVRHYRSDAAVCLFSLIFFFFFLNLKRRAFSHDESGSLQGVGAPSLRFQLILKYVYNIRTAATFLANLLSVFVITFPYWNFNKTRFSKTTSQPSPPTPHHHAIKSFRIHFKPTHLSHEYL